MRKNVDLTEAAQLRLKAEKLLESNHTLENVNLCEVEALKLVHELQVHKIELEMQNEELLLAKTAANEAADK